MTQPSDQAATPSPRAVSETVSRKRGRPTKFTPQELELARFAAGGERVSERQLQNLVYRLKAVGQLADHPRLTWLCDGKAMAAGGAGKKAWKPTILTELGRVDDAEYRLQLALELCSLRPPVYQGVRLVRNRRLLSLAEK